MFLDTLAIIVLLIWLYLTFAHGRYWQVRRHISSSDNALQTCDATVIAIVPARDEADVIGRCVIALLQQTLPNPLQVILVDDGSSDGTAQTAQAAAQQIGASERLTVIAGTRPPDGWTGKLWALSQGAALAEKAGPDYFLFTDADIHHEPNSLAELVSLAQTSGCDLASCMVLLATDTWAERLLIPAFVYFFFQLYPPAFIQNKRRATAGAAGGCVLLRPQALNKAGGFASIRSEVIDDCALARVVKRSGGKIMLQLTRNSRSIRSYGSFAGIRRMIARSAFFQLRHSYMLLAATLTGLLLTYCAPLAFLLAPTLPLRLAGALSYVLMSYTFLPTIRLYRQNRLLCASLPLVALFYAWATLQSAYNYASGVGGSWKGRVQDRRS